MESRKTCFHISITHTKVVYCSKHFIVKSTVIHICKVKQIYLYNFLGYNFQVKNAIRLRRLTFGIFDKAVRRVGEARQDPKSLRWYMPISPDDLKDIRAKYWVTEEEGSDDNGDGGGDMRTKVEETAEKVGGTFSLFVCFIARNLYQLNANEVTLTYNETC